MTRSEVINGVHGSRASAPVVRTMGVMSTAPAFTETEIRYIAADALADLRTVRRALDGEKIKGRVLAERIQAAIDKAKKARKS